MSWIKWLGATKVGFYLDGFGVIDKWFERMFGISICSVLGMLEEEMELGDY